MKPWSGLTPPPFGQGYYPPERDFPDFFAPAPGSTTNRFSFKEVLTDLDDGVAAKVQQYVNGALRYEYTILEEVLTTSVVKILRDRGWKVTPPAGPPAEPFSEDEARKDLARIRRSIDDLKRGIGIA